MKGIVFTEFFSLVEKTWSADMVEDLIDDVNPASGAAYTSVGTYDHQEIVAMVGALAKRTKMSIPDLLHTFGCHLFSVFKHTITDSSKELTIHSIFCSIDNHIHVEARKLYRDAELPSFEIADRNDTTLTLIYRSKRGFADLARGLIESTCQHWETPVEVACQDQSKGELHQVEFVITKV